MIRARYDPTVRGMVVRWPRAGKGLELVIGSCPPTYRAAIFAHELGHLATLAGGLHMNYTSDPRYWECRAWAWAMHKYGADPAMRRAIRRAGRAGLASYGVPKAKIERAVRWRGAQ